MRPQGGTERKTIGMQKLSDIWTGSIQGGAAGKLAPIGRMLDLVGLTVCAMPPGRVDATSSKLPLSVQVSPFRQASVDRLSVWGRTVPVDKWGAAHGGFDLFARDIDYEIACSNPDWELLIEFDDARVGALAAEDHDGAFGIDRPYLGSVDRPVRALGALAVDHLRDADQDPLYIEGLAIAIGARTLGLATECTKRTPTTGTDARITRALDYIGDNLGLALSVAELAAVACISPSWFARAFRAHTGQPIHAYVREQRLERAMAHVREDRLPLAEIAFRCGFADQSHMGRQFRKRFGVTPAKAKAS